MRRSHFRVPAMDCPSEEQLIRAALAGAEVTRFDFDLEERTVTIWHDGDVAPIRTALGELKLGAELVDSAEAEAGGVAPETASDEAGVLRALLVINAVMFVVELVAGWLGESAGLLSDSLDMLADASVYAVALSAVGKTAARQRTAARIAGWLELLLALGVLAEVARRAFYGSEPEPPVMMATAAVALAANVACMMLLARHRHGGIHMRASWIFSANDVIANLGVVVAGALVLWTSSAIPDLVIGTVIGLVVLRGALRILRLARVPGE